MKKIKWAGFNLIELLIALAILGILISLTLPLYSGYIVTAERMEAETELVKLAGLLEEYFTNYHTYKNASFENLNFHPFVAHSHYQIFMKNLTDEGFSLEAYPLNHQDTLCGTLVLNAIGEKGIKGKGTVSECW